MIFQQFVTTKASARDHIYSSENALKITDGNLEVEKCSGGEFLDLTSRDED
jgi:hypothetical protein